VRDAPLARPGAQAGVLVAPVTGVPHAAALADRLADALRKRDVLAVTDAANRGSYVLTGRATGDDAGNAVTIHWRLADARGRVIGERTQTTGVTAAAWQTGAAATLDRIATEAAHMIAPLAGDTNAPGAVKPAPRVLTVHSVDGAPGDGDVALRRALAYTLGRHGFRVVDGLDGAEVVIAGAVRVTPAGPASEQVTITWSALAPDGASLGTVEQSNRVPKGSLDGNWGVIAIQVVEAAAPGIAQLVEKARPSEAAAADSAP